MTWQDVVAIAGVLFALIQFLLPTNIPLRIRFSISAFFLAFSALFVKIMPANTRHIIFSVLLIVTAFLALLPCIGKVRKILNRYRIRRLERTLKKLNTNILRDFLVDKIIQSICHKDKKNEGKVA